MNTDVRACRGGCCLLAAALLIFFLSTGMTRAQTDEQVAINLGGSFYANNATYIDPSLFIWPTATPASRGLSESVLVAGDAVLQSDSRAASFLVARDGALVHESYFHGAQAAHAKNIQSASKSILSALVGVAIDRGLISLSTRIGDVLPHPMSPAKGGITVEHLLTLTSGLDWEEDTTEYTLGDDFVKSILDLPLRHPPGSQFNYSSGDTHLLGAMIAEASGQSLHQFGKQQLFDRIGIDVERWGRDSQGYFSGGVNFFLTPREMAAFGQLYLDGGLWNGSQIVPADWVAQSTSPQGQASYYGYLWWRDVALDGHLGYRAWGWGKQFIYVLPSLETIAVITHDTQGNVDDSDLNDFVSDYVVRAVVGSTPGDFNNDGTVDAADYVLWRKNHEAFGGDEGYNTWRASFDRTVGAASRAAQSALNPPRLGEPTAAVPEPDFAAMLLAGLVLTAARRARTFKGCRRSPHDSEKHFRRRPGQAARILSRDSGRRLHLRFRNVGHGAEQHGAGAGRRGA